MGQQKDLEGFGVYRGGIGRTKTGELLGGCANMLQDLA